MTENIGTPKVRSLKVTFSKFLDKIRKTAFQFSSQPLPFLGIFDFNGPVFGSIHYQNNQTYTGTHD